MGNTKVNNYELVLVFPEMENSKLETARSNIEAAMTKRQAKVTDKQILGSKPLFHEKNHHNRGNFNCWKFSAEPAVLGQITNELNVSSEVLKSMIVKVG